MRYEKLEWLIVSILFDGKTLENIEDVTLPTVVEVEEAMLTCFLSSEKSLVPVIIELILT